MIRPKQRARHYLKMARNKEFYATIEKGDNMIWKTSETYHNRADAVRAMAILAEMHGVEWDNDYLDLSYGGVTPFKKSTKKKA